MDTQRIIELCAKEQNVFSDMVEQFSYEAKGIIASELLLFISLVKQYEVRVVIESGRARGYSTEVIAEALPSCLIKSIEYDKYTKDSLIAMRNLRSMNNVELYYGDATKMAPQMVAEKSVVLIDGPKGTQALWLAATLLENPLVQCVCVHDLHKDSQHRVLAEKMFGESFFSDNDVFVEHFKDIDAACWRELEAQPKTKGWGPYRRGSRVMQSYSATLGCFFAVNADWRATLGSFNEPNPHKPLWRVLLSRIWRFVRRVAVYLRRLTLFIPVEIYERIK